VGKSALFNRMVRERKALVEELAGTTRDRLYGDVQWRDTSFRLVDTGGLEPENEEGYPTLVREQVEQGVREAQLLLFVVDAKAGITAADLEVADVLRRTQKPVLLLANKVENEERRQAAAEFYELGLGEPMPISAQHGTGVDDVLDRIVDELPAAPPATATAEGLRLAIVGRPNVGKSMLTNAILGEERVIVSEAPGTTRDAIDTAFQYREKPLVLIDTAGLRRPGKLGRGLEKHAAMRARAALERADVALVVFDAPDGLTTQDVHVIGHAVEAAKGLILVANKWDLMEGASIGEFEQQARRKLKFAPWASFRVVSAKEQVGIDPLLKEALRIGEERRRRIETGRLNAVLQPAIAAQEPPVVRNQRPKFFYVTQARVAPPTFVFFVNDASLVHFTYKRYLENVIRRSFAGFAGTAVRLVFRSRDEEKPAEKKGG
jgi:GTP-binding protein